MALHTKIGIGLIAGLAVGLLANLADIQPLINFVLAIVPLGTAWIRLITMVVIPLVVASLVVGTASLGDITRLGRIGGKTIAYYLVTTSIAISIGLLLSNIIRPGSRIPEASKSQLLETFQGEAAARIDLAQDAPGLVDVLLNLIPRNPVAAAANGEMLQIILFAILFGAALSLVQQDRRDTVLNFFHGVNDIAMILVDWIMKLAPYAVFALLAGVVARFGFAMLTSLAMYTVTVVVGLILHATITYPTAVHFIGRMNPLHFFRNIREPQIIGFSTSSSNATLPVTIETAREKLGVSDEVSSFVLPLGATINMDGTALYQGVAVMFIAQVFGIDLSVGAQLMVVLTATLASIGAAGVPSAGIIMLALVLQQAGIPAAGIALILGVDRILDMCRTSVNLTGDLSCAVVIARTEGEALVPRPVGVEEAEARAAIGD